MELNREMFESEVLEINDLEAEVVLSFLTEGGRQEIQTCPGDSYKIVNMLMDYARMLEMAVEQWELWNSKGWRGFIGRPMRFMRSSAGSGRRNGGRSGTMVWGKTPWCWP